MSVQADEDAGALRDSGPQMLTSPNTEEQEKSTSGSEPTGKECQQLVDSSLVL